MSKLYIKNHFGTTPDKILNRNDLSMKAKGLFGYLQSKPDGWKFSEERITKQSRDGRDSIQSGLQELEKAGYLKRTLIRDENGKWKGYDYLLYEKPVGGFPIDGKPIDLSNTDNSKTDENKTRKRVLQKNTTPSKGKQDDLLLTVKEIYEFWNSKKIVVHRKLREDIKNEIKKALKKYTVTEIKKMITLYSTIFHGDEYFWDYKWNLVEFLKRGLRQFEGKGVDDYLREGYKEEREIYDFNNNIKKVFKGDKLIREESIH